MKPYMKNASPSEENAMTDPSSNANRLSHTAPLSDFVEVRSVDAFQGREKECIFLCGVRSNSNHSLGFVSQARRLNVALTRARSMLVVIGDEKTLRNSPAWDSFYHFKNVIGTNILKNEIEEQ